MTQLTAEDSPPMPIAGHVDVFGLPVQTFTGRDVHGISLSVSTNESLGSFVSTNQRS